MVEIELLKLIFVERGNFEKKYWLFIVFIVFFKEIYLF